MLSMQEVNVLGQIFDTTWGRSSTARTGSPIHSIKCYLVNDAQICIDYTTVVTFASESSLRDQKAAFENESVQVTRNVVKNTKKQFKDGSGRALKLKELSTDDSIEIINVSPYSPRKTAYYRRKTILEVS